MLRASWAVGATHWEHAVGAFREAELPGPTPTPFFAPAQIKKRSKDWGAAGFQQRFGAAWRRFMKPVSNGWMHVTYAPGQEAVERVYAAALDGRLDPREGHALSLSS